MEAEPRLLLAMLSWTVATVSLRLFSPHRFSEPGVQGSGALCLCPHGYLGPMGLPCHVVEFLFTASPASPGPARSWNHCSGHCCQRQAQVEDFIVSKRKVHDRKLHCGNFLYSNTSVQTRSSVKPGCLEASRPTVHKASSPPPRCPVTSLAWLRVGRVLHHSKSESGYAE